MEYIVDMQGFKGCNEKEFIFKEVAIIFLEEDATPSVFLFQPPLSWSYLSAKQKSENRCLENNYLGMMWSSGEIPYEQVADTQQRSHQCCKNICKGSSEERVA